MRLRAICPSRASVMLAQAKTISANSFENGTISVSRKKMKNGTRMTLSTVSLFGRFIISLRYFIFQFPSTETTSPTRS